MLDFFKTTQLDYIELGQTKKWILNNFPTPDVTSNISITKSDIWKYGDLEFHFVDDKLRMIFSDCLESFTMGNSFILDVWFIKDYHNLTLLYVIEQLNQQQIGFSLVHPT